MSPPDPLAGWRLAERLSVEQAALLIAGVDPAKVDMDPRNYDGYEAAVTALRNAVLGNSLPAALAFRPEVPSPFGEDLPSRGLTVVLSSVTDVEKLRGMPTPDLDKPLRLQGEPDWSSTAIAVEHLKAWLQSRGQFPAFFFPTEVPPDFMNRDDPRYSPKLACAVAAWEKVTEKARNKSVKQTIKAWVLENAANFGLLDKDSKVPNEAAEQIAKVVNWAPEGGATPSGGGQVPGTSPPPPLTLAQNYQRLSTMPRKS